MALVEEKYAQNMNKSYHEADEFVCSNCGIYLTDWTRHIHYDEDCDEEYFMEYQFKYCPERGAKIV